MTFPPREPSPLDTAEFTFEEILQRLELGRLQVEATEEGSRLRTAHVQAPDLERRRQDRVVAPHQDRRRFRPLDLPTLFPERGPILILLVGGFADDAALQRPLPYWEDDPGGGYLVWQALALAGLLHKKDADFALGRGGFWDVAPPRTLGLAMTYVGYRRAGEALAFDHVVHPWNLHRLQTLLEGCWARSMGRLKVVTLGEAARFMMCGTAYPMPGIPVLSIPEPTQEHLERNLGNDSTAGQWLEFASDLLAIGRG
ncbi:MAG: hypothetical protein BWY56_00395 [Acidobacteria bacterium ADurb.Bin340]|nr:MAG: hypothetical protein BWY56_00395 [Acidobacteria bacterium ADurb.Bin340]HOD32019.1 hypothetical protein [Holophaga sp.]HQL48507.1 hypothetical protein [Holophaga sp.]